VSAGVERVSSAVGRTEDPPDIAAQHLCRYRYGDASHDRRHSMFCAIRQRRRAFHAIPEHDVLSRTAHRPFVTPSAPGAWHGWPRLPRLGCQGTTFWRAPVGCMGKRRSRWPRVKRRNRGFRRGGDDRL
jgi:hypothetical protein